VDTRDKVVVLINRGYAIKATQKNEARTAEAQGDSYFTGFHASPEAERWLSDIKIVVSRHLKDHPLSLKLEEEISTHHFEGIIGALESVYNDDDYFANPLASLSNEQGYQLHQRELPKNSYDLLTEIIASEAPARMLADKFIGLSSKEDSELRAILRELTENGFINVIKWADNVPFYLELNNSARVYVAELRSRKQIAVTPAEVSENRVTIDIRLELYQHIEPFLGNRDYFHAVEESFKLVREKLRELTGSEKATDAFAEANYPMIFGFTPTSEQDKDFFQGVKFLNMAIQYFRNEKAHTPAYSINQNLALHYIALASLAYDLISNAETLGNYGAD